MEPPVDEERAGDAEPLRPDVEPLRPGAEPLRTDAKPLRPDAEPLRPDAEPLRPDAEPLIPDAEPFQADPRPVRQEPAGRFAEKGEASSKAQPFHSEESEGASAPGGASDSRIEDVFADIARKFTSFIHFKMFALAGNGLRLSAGEVSTIIADNPDSVEDKKFGMLDLWKEKNGSRASPTNIAEVFKQHFRQEGGGFTGSRIEDAFLAVPKVFDNAALFQRFALSGKGLSLSMHEVGNIKENAKNVGERNLDLLVLWKLKNGDSATTEKIWQLVKAFMDERGESHPDQPPLHPRPMELPVDEERAGDAEPLRFDAKPLRPAAEPLRPYVQPLRLDAKPLRPDAEPLRPDAEPLRPDAEPSQADPRPGKQEPAKLWAATEGQELLTLFYTIL
uniref:uncharacterized protein LOC120333711 n=1 Tax=Styela clava TaxID=7725 RepID=UPI00193A4CDE|nr:uncharacterized protein LOC120333711 [Styela clava]